MVKTELEAENERLKAEIARLKAENDRLGWTENPDRMGGMFTAEEIERSRRGGDGW